MFDLTQILHSYFEIKLEIENEEGKPETLVLKVKEPSVKMLGEIQKLRVDKSPENLCGTLAKILSNNTAGYKVTKEALSEFPVKDLALIYRAYTEWEVEQSNSKN